MLKVYLSKIVVGLAFLSGVASGQSLAPLKSPLSFEVASIKPVAPLDAKAFLSGRQPGMLIDKAMVRISNNSLMEMVWWAYRLSSNRIVGGPAWLAASNAQRFDVVAKMPDGATQEQVPDMLQTLLVERFKLVAHREKRNASAYALTVALGGARLQEAVPNPNGPEGEETHTSEGKNGRFRLEFDSVTMERFVSLLSRYVDRPVVDQTGLKGWYHADYEIDLLASAKKALASVDPDADTGNIPDPRDAIVSSLKQLGLKLEPRVLPTEMLVIDHIEKTPTAN